METTNFFSLLAAVPASSKAGWTLHIRHTENGRVSVSVLYKDAGCGDSAAVIVPPLVFNNQPEKIDQVFFNDLREAMGSATAAFSSMEHYLKQVEEAKKQSAESKGKKLSGQTDTRTDKEKKYDDGMNAAAELEKQGKYREAWMKVPSMDEYPEREQELRKRRSELSAKFAPDLFNDGKSNNQDHVNS